MKRGVYLFLCLASFCSVSVFASVYNLKPVKITENVWCFFGERSSPTLKNKGNMVNSCFFDGGDISVAIDTGPTYTYAKEAAEIIKKTTKKAPSLVINTHYHDDHLGGNLYYKEAGAKIIGDINIKKAYEQKPDRFDRMQKMLPPSIAGKSGVALPTEYIESNTTVKTANGDIEILKLSKHSHTESDVVVFLKKQKAVIAGDIVFNDMISPLRDADINGWLEAIAALKKLDNKYLVGGHGDKTSKNGYEFMEGYLTKLRDSVRTAIKEGADMNTITQKVDMSGYKNAAIYDEVNGKNILRAYELFEME